MPKEMCDFYFTFAMTKRHPFTGGWDVVRAESEEEALTIFRKKYPPDEFGDRYAGMYTDEEFHDTSVNNFERDGNIGQFCHEFFIEGHEEKYGV